MTAAKHVCAWPRCGKMVLPSEYIRAVGENSGPKVYGCATHRPRMELTKGIVGASALAGFQVGMDKAFPGVREKIGQIGGIAMDILQSARKTEPTE